jgi:hypothetical protein
LAIFDRVAIGDQLMRLHWPGHEDELGEPMSADDAVEEFQEGLMASRSSGECPYVSLFLLPVQSIQTSLFRPACVLGGASDYPKF